MEVKTLLMYWEGSTFLFDVNITEKERKHENVVAKGRALVSTKKRNNGKYAGHCCLIGEEQYTDEHIRKQVVWACVKRAILLQRYVIIEGRTSQEDMIYVNTDE